MFVRFNANPTASRVGDCTVRAISKALGKEWEDTYIDLAIEGLLLHDMPSSNFVWGNYLLKNGYERNVITNTCPDCYTVRRFAEDHRSGTYILAISGHVVAVIDGNYYDTWDSGDEVPVYYWRRSK